MSTKSKREIMCPNCECPQKVVLFTGINSVQNPELKDRILKEDIFDFKCNKCGYKAQMTYPLVFINSTSSYVIAFNPIASDEEIFDDDRIKKFTKRTVKSLAELKEKILIFDNNLDDVAIELVKNSFLGLFRNKYQNENIQMFFSHVDIRDDITLALFVGDENKPIYERVQFMMYKQSAEVLKSIAYKEPEGFLRVDIETVKILTKGKAI